MQTDFNIFKIIENLPEVNILIYKDKILYFNKSVLEKLGYSEAEFKALKLEDLVPEDYLKKIEDLKSKNLFNAKFHKIIENFPVITKDKRLLKCTIFISSIKFKNTTAGLIIAFDNTEKHLFNRTIDLIGKIYELSNNEINVDNFINNVCKNISTYFEIYFSTVVQYNDSSGSFNIKNTCTKCCDLDDLFLLNSILKDKNFIEKLKSNKILTGEIDYKILKSFCAIPIIIENELRYVFIFCSRFSNFMDNLNLELLEKLKYTISINIEKIEKEKNLLILYNALENSPDWVLITDRNGIILYANKTVEKLSKFSKKELIGKTPALLKSGYYDKKFYEKMWKTLLSGEPFNCVILNKDKYGEYFKVEHLIIPVKIGDEITHFVAVGKDLSREEKLEGEIVNLKFKDLITGLLNRYGFLVELEKEINDLKHGETGILALIDIYNFSYINNLYSEKVGNEILREVGELLKKINKNGIIGRIGGDEFAIFRKINKDNIVEYVVSLIEIFKISKFSSKEFVIGVNIGAAIYPDDAKDVNQLLNNARSSLNIAKISGENHYQFFNKDIENFILKKKKEKDLIIEALENNYFEVYLQPYFYTTNKKLAGFEALLRINHPEKGVLTPYYFIETLEESEYLFDVEKFLIKKVSNTLIRWKKEFNNIIKPISINLTVRSFRNEEVISYLKNWLKKIGKPLLNVEITERLFFENFDYTVNVIHSLKEFGVLISLDDFGTGYSSLSYLSEIPIDIIKIDISFVRKMMQDLKTKAIIEVVITLAKKFGFKTIAEGVETEEQFNILKNMGCDIIQGYLLGKPCPIIDAESYFNL